MASIARVAPLHVMAGVVNGDDTSMPLLGIQEFEEIFYLNKQIVQSLSIQNELGLLDYLCLFLSLLRLVLSAPAPLFKDAV